MFVFNDEVIPREHSKNVKNKHISEDQTLEMAKLCQDKPRLFLVEFSFLLLFST